MESNRLPPLALAPCLSVPWLSPRRLTSIDPGGRGYLPETLASRTDASTREPHDGHAGHASTRLASPRLATPRLASPTQAHSAHIADIVRRGRATHRAKRHWDCGYSDVTLGYAVGSVSRSTLQQQM